MDYLEGMLLHSWWSDTDYETRKHKGTWVFYSFLMFLALAGTVAQLNLTGTATLTNYNGIMRVFLIVLFLLTPIICKVYFKLPFVGRLVALSALAFKYLSLFIFIISSVANLLILPESVTINSILNWGNTTVGDFLTETTARFQVSGLFIGGFIIGIISLLIGLLILAILVFYPILLLKAFNLCQYMWDMAFLYVLEKVNDKYIVNSSQDKLLNKKKITQEAKKDIQ